MCGGGNLAEYRLSTNVSEPMARYLFYQILQGVSIMHSRGIAHMDLRLNNILLDNDANVRIGDFGCALSFVDDNDWVQAGNMTGQPSHMPPEML